MTSPLPAAEAPKRQDLGNGRLYLVHEFERRAYPLAGEATTIGRDSACDVFVPEPTVSRTHARIHSSGADVTLESLGASGTYVNGTPVTAAQPLAAGDRIEIGTTVLTIRRAPLPIGVSVVDRTREKRKVDDPMVRRPTIRRPILPHGGIGEKHRHIARWVLVAVIVALALAALLRT